MDVTKLKDCTMDTCARCGQTVGLENIFTIPGFGGKYFLIPFCETHVDAVIAEETAKLEKKEN
jgi:hypothetical protein